MYYKTHFLFITILIFVIGCQEQEPKRSKSSNHEAKNNDPKVLLRELADTTKLDTSEFSSLVRYGYKLIVNTPYYIGPNGSKGKYLGNLMSCSNCHIDAGTKLYGLSFHSTFGNYPQYRSRENKVLNIEDRINNCIQRPHNGTPLPLDSKEMLAIVCYLKWLGETVPIGYVPEGSKLPEIPLLNRPANPAQGELIYKEHCLSCHGENGEGKLNETGVKFLYPPLWGENSYQKGSSMYRLLKITSFVYYNMPFGKAQNKKPFLTLEQAYDVSAFVNDLTLHERPDPKNGKHGYENLETKPIDYPHGPYLDPYSEKQHRLGPYQVILEYNNTSLSKK